MDTVPAACDNPTGQCLFLGNANNVPGSGTEPSFGDCSEGFIFSAETKHSPLMLTSISLDQDFRTLADALRGAELLSTAIRPPSNACPYLSSPWRDLDRGRDCLWAAEGKWVIHVAIRIVQYGHVWQANLGLSKEQL